MNKRDIILILIIVLSTFFITKSCDKKQPSINTDIYKKVLNDNENKINQLNNQLLILNDSNKVLNENYINILENYKTSTAALKPTKFKTLRDTILVEVYLATDVEQVLNDCDSTINTSNYLLQIKDSIIDTQDSIIIVLNNSNVVLTELVDVYIENEKQFIKQNKKDKWIAFAFGNVSGFILTKIFRL